MIFQVLNHQMIRNSPLEKLVKSIITFSDGISTVECQINDYVYQGFPQNDWKLSF